MCVCTEHSFTLGPMADVRVSRQDFEDAFKKVRPSISEKVKGLGGGDPWDPIQWPVQDGEAKVNCNGALVHVCAFWKVFVLPLSPHRTGKCTRL